MSDDLTLPGSIPGLLRRGSPLLDGAVVVSIDGDGAIACRDEESDDQGVYHNVRSEWLPDLALDLSDATGRAHAAWWLAREAKNWPGEPVYSDAAWMRRDNLVRAWGMGPGHWWPVTHRAFAGLDSADPRTLPDGSRWVDAEALRRVCLHVAGMDDQP